MKLISTILTVAFALSISAEAATINAATGNPTDVQAAMDLAEAGDTVVIPAGTFNWSAGVSWAAPANVTLKGAGTSATGGGDQTTIIDDYDANDELLLITGTSFRITGITFESGTASEPKNPGTIGIYGTQVRIDHCHLDFQSSVNYQAVRVGAGTFGVMDHCILDLGGNSNCIYFANGRKDPDQSGPEPDIQGNYEWTLPHGLGTSDFFYVEDNIINGTGTISFGGATYYYARLTDTNAAARFVIRFNSMRDIVVSDTHGTGHGGDDRGERAREIYGNSVATDYAGGEPYPNIGAIHLNSGTGMIWGNSWPGVYRSQIYTISLVRKNNTTYPQAATPSGWGYAGTAFNGTGSMWDGGTALGTDTVGGYPAIDQVGRGQGQLLKGYFPSKLNNATGTITWPNQIAEPVYIWDNGGVVAPSGFTVNEVSDGGGGRVAADRDYYLPASGIQTSPTSPFDGTTGTGWGTLANRPTTCTTGVAYFATDQGSWNTSESNPYGVQQNGASGVLYVATATNTWTQYYEPYTYPHPLRGESASGRKRVKFPGGDLRIGGKRVQVGE